MEQKNRAALNLKTGLLSVILLVYLVPFILVVINAFKPTREFLENPLALPGTVDFTNFTVAFEKMNFLRGLQNTFVITAASVLLIGSVPANH